jgi:DNA invertase Pin-like site-specific DNA recombinase
LDGVHLDKVFTEKVSGGNREARAALRSCLDYLRDGDTLHVHSIDRLARNLKDLQDIVSDLTARGVAVRFHKESLLFTGDNTDPMQTLMFQMMGAFAQFERDLIRARQREGIAAAKAAGKHLGRPPAFAPEQVRQIQERRTQGEAVTAIAKDLGVSRQTVYTLLRDKAA